MQDGLESSGPSRPVDMVDMAGMAGGAMPSGCLGRFAPGAAVPWGDSPHPLVAGDRLEWSDSPHLAQSSTAATSFRKK
jgi:hypothetical protein